MNSASTYAINTDHVAKRIIFTLLYLFTATISYANPQFEGTWSGKLSVGGSQLPLLFHLNYENEQWQSTLDSPAQGAKGIKVDSVLIENCSIHIVVNALRMSYQGALEPSTSTISGTFSQGGLLLPLLLKKEEGIAAQPKRPQSPAAPFPYEEREITFRNEKGNIYLAGTLTLPKHGDPVAAVVLVSGSGPQNRDEEIAGHRPFAVLADYLSRRGIAVLRYDDRGVAQSEGKHAEASTADFADDAEAALRYLATIKGINPSKIGIIGHSEGGIVAPMVAQRNNQVAFIALLAGTGVDGGKVIVQQSIDIAKQSGASDEYLKSYSQDLQRVVDAAASANNLQEYRTTITELFRKTFKEEKVINQHLTQFGQKWIFEFMRLDPTVALKKVTCPVLALWGSKDLQVSPQLNAPAVKSALSHNKRCQIEVLEGLNHLFQTATTGIPNEYYEIEETIAPVALKIIGDWVLKQ